MKVPFVMSFRSVGCLCEFVLIYVLDMQLPGDLADPDSPAQVRLNAAVEKLNAESAKT
jgi:hypothetical protein